MLTDTHFPLDAPAYLRAEYAKRRSRRPAYSLRAFARDLELGVSTLSEFLRGKGGMSYERALFISKKLDLSPEQMEHFCDLVQIRGQETVEQIAARRRIERRLSHPEGSLSLDQFASVANWYHLAILELIDLSPIYQNASVLAETLFLEISEVEEAIDRLVRLSLLVKTPEGRLNRASAQTVVGQDVPSQAIRTFHRQMIEQGMQTLETVPIDQRKFQSIVFSIRMADCKEFSSELEKLTMQLVDKFHQRSGKERVYGLTTQLFPLHEPLQET